jgi:N-acetylneuraminic acid mutarotase
LSDGKVLVAGGYYNNSALNTAELYDPATGTWSITGNLNTARSAYTATLLSDGKVLVAGGYYNNSALNTAELYDPATGTWSITGNLNTALYAQTATLLLNGKVLVTGYNSAELYDPATGTWSITGNLNAFRTDHTATLLPSGKVMVAAGGDENYHTILPAELYDPTTGMWSYTGSLNTGRTAHTMMLLPDGKVLVAGGLDTYDYDTLSSAELFDTAQIKPPQITGVSISGKKLFIQGENFDEGAKILLNDDKQKSANDEQSPGTLLIGRKAGKRIGLGETVRLKVRNSDGTESAEFSYTRPAQ